MSPTSVAYGGYTNLSYTSSNASYCNEYVNGGLVWSNAPTSFNWGTVGPYYANQTWTIMCYNSAGASGQDSKTLTVAAASCPTTTIGSCSLSPTASGGTSGSCIAGYTGSCSYSCSNGSWYQNSNSCAPPAASCPTTTIGSCSLSPTASGGTSGSCIAGYTGSCSYSCSNGTWYASSNSCAAPANCTTPWGNTIASGVSVLAFSTPSVVSPAACPASQNRLCTSGTLSGSYQYQNCTVLNPTATISASPTRVQSGKTTTVTWSSTDTTSCTVSGPGLSASGTSGSQPVTVTSQAVYTVSCNSGAATATATVNVVPTFQEF